MGRWSLDEMGSKNFFLTSEVQIAVFLGVKLEMCLMRSSVVDYFLLRTVWLSLKVLQEVHLSICLTECVVKESLFSLVLYVLSIVRSD